MIEILKAANMKNKLSCCLRGVYSFLFLSIFLRVVSMLSIDKEVIDPKYMQSGMNVILR
ncbi:hypothetical protein ISS03_02995 [Patescibacteria group bacterium]|nr:hypothetical protein [Patescibacteria group bacterium]